MGSGEIVAELGGVAAVLGVVGGVLRYLVRLAATMERTSALAQSTCEGFQRHMESSGALHAALTDRMALHDTEIAVLQTRLDGFAGGAHP